MMASSSRGGGRARLLVFVGAFLCGAMRAEAQLGFGRGGGGMGGGGGMAGALGGAAGAE
jgi:hypothetical protein